SRPMADRPVWIGYDPNGASGKGDSGAISVNAVPMVAGGKFRTVETLRIRGMEFEEQANLIIGMLSRYNVQHIGIDGTGIGEAVYQLVKKHLSLIHIS
ncbi:oxidoreductase, partial [Klebsiella pneumoniae]|nr:oxidoreductase [Klebsiella pneumoniae]